MAREVRAVFYVNDVNQLMKKVALLITLVGKSGYSLLKNLCMPDLPSTKMYTELTKMMQSHLQPPPSVITERYKFKKCIQGEGEEVKVFCANLKRLTRNCAFGTELSKHLRDQFVWGVREESIKKRLLGEKDLTFDKAVELASAMEAASKDAAGMTIAGGGASGSLNFVREKKSKFTPGKSRASNKNKNGGSNNKASCHRCGYSNHGALKCRFIEFICNFCSKKGHIERACNQKK